MTINPTKIAVGIAALALLAPAFAFAASNDAQYCRGQAGFALDQSLRSGTLVQMQAYGNASTPSARTTSRLQRRVSGR